MHTSRSPRFVGALVIAIVLCASLPGKDSPTEISGAALWALGRDLANDGQWDQATPIHERITREYPDYAFGWMGLGWSYGFSGRPAEAIPAFRRALALGALPAFRIHHEMARAYVALGDHAAALAALEQAVADGYPARANLARDRFLAALKDEPRFRALVGEVEPSDTIGHEAAWRADILFLRGELQRLYPSPRNRPPVAEHALAVLEEECAQLDSAEITCRLMRIFGAELDGHSFVEPDYLQQDDAPTLPLLFFLFEDGMHVIAAREGHEELLWARIDRINGRTVADVVAALGPYIPRDNELWIKTRMPLLVRHPRFLQFVGLGSSDSSVEFDLVDRTGEARRVSVAATAPGGALKRKPSDDAPLPLHYGRRSQLYWFQHDQAAQEIYLQFNGSGNQRDERLEDFASRLAKVLQEPGLARLVVDLRWHGGGNQNLNMPLLRAIMQSPLNRAGALYVITGRHTFSAGMIFAAQLERYTDAVFVGEPTGSSPNFIGENNFFSLPHSKLSVSLSDLAWQNSVPRDHRVWIAPSLPAPMHFAAWCAGRDEALEAIRRHAAR